MVKNFVAHIDLDWTEAGGRSTAAEGFFAGRLAERDVKGFSVVDVRTKGVSVFSFNFIIGEIILGKTK
jgi:hypothetical protein